jgi:hypothetical protein
MMPEETFYTCKQLKFLHKIKSVIICLASILFSCNQENTNSDYNKIKETDPLSRIVAHRSSNKVMLNDTTIIFLWRDVKFDVELKDSFNSILINDDYCKIITGPERAALGYVATFIGNECYWDGQANTDRSNLNCKILTSLNLGYQCSDKHIGFLKQWFRNDPETLAELQNCPTTPYTATIQETFDKITITIHENEISVWFCVSGINVRDQVSWSWTETDYFEYDNDNIKLIKKEKSQVKLINFETET